jgi:chromosome segregation ATPase
VGESSIVARLNQVPQWNSFKPVADTAAFVINDLETELAAKTREAAQQKEGWENCANLWRAEIVKREQAEWELAEAKAKLTAAQDGVTKWQHEAERLREEKEFYKRRCDALQKEQSGMRDPERQIVCDILANGKRDAAIDAARARGCA